MLDFFPTPFPDEWWYSVLCRYYLSFGIKASQPIKEILFSNKDAQMASKFPNGTVAKVVKQLPKDVFSFDYILENHTLYRYYVRFAPKIEEENMRRSLSQGGNPQISHMKTIYGYNRLWAPMYCPMCAIEDSKNYGISYYHSSHQIPLVTVCPKHGIKLHQINNGPGDGYYMRLFRALSLEKLDMSCKEVSEAEINIARLASDYLTKPLSIGPTEGYNNLIQVLLNKGYYKFQSKAGRIIDTVKLQADLNNVYGEALVSEVFGGELISTHISRIGRFFTLNPDKYILLQAFAGLSFDDFLVNGRIEDLMLKKMLEIRDRNEFVTLVDVANMMGLKEHEVIRFAKSYGLEPFWVGKYHRSREINAVKKKIVFTVTEDEYEKISVNARKHGFQCAGEYLVQLALNNAKLKY